MKGVTRNPEVIKRYVASFEKVKEKIESGKLKLTEHDGDLSMGNFDDGKRYYAYRTGSGKGDWYLSSTITNSSEALVFEGRRCSFKNGSSLLDWEPKRSDGWSIMKSTHLERGVFESKKDFYGRKIKGWINKGTPEYIVIEVVSQEMLPFISQYYETSILDFDRTLEDMKIVYDERDVDMEFLNKQVENIEITGDDEL